MAKILIVDDSATSVAKLSDILKDQGHELVVGRNGWEALTIALDESPDVILLDIMMPKINGLEVCQHLKECPELMTIPIILITGKGSDEDIVRGLDAGADDYIAKPVSSKILAARVRTAARAKATSDELSEVNEHLQRKIIERKRVEVRMAEHTRDIEITNIQLNEVKATLQSVIEEQVRTNEELKQKNAELDEFSYVASHDLQEPVRKLISFSQLLREDVGEGLSNDAEDDLANIIDGAMRMKMLIQDLLRLSRAGRDAMQWDRVSLDDCVDDVLDVLADRIEDCNAVIVRDDLPNVAGDKTMLTQLYQNLLSNALKFIDVRLPEIHFTAERDDRMWILGIRDNGIGIKSEFAQQIFRPFKRLHKRGKYPGTGIGLAICKKNVNRHGGRIWVESEPGRGTHFKFTLKDTKEKGKASCQLQLQEN